ncbi:MAG: hypothetical protein JWP38_3482 [Herbaspirillum sp.]|nr:hypothetical protein [Herbaspirillum sp.]
MLFLILRKAGKNTEAGLMPGAELFSAMGSYHEQMAQAGILRAGEGLQPSAKGVRVKLSDGKASVIDGPFAETKELIAGFSMIDVASKQEAIEWVKRWPVEDGDVTLEIREVGCPGGCVGVDPAEAAALAGAAGNGGKPGIRFAILLRSDQNTEADAVPDSKLIDAMNDYNRQAVKDGVLLAGQGLQSSTKGARVQFSGGKPIVTDGPFAEIKELIAGFWIIRVASKHDAIAWASRYPYPLGAKVEVEIRQVYEAEDFGDAFPPEMREAEERMRAQLLESGMQPTLAGAPR